MHCKNISNTGKGFTINQQQYIRENVFVKKTTIFTKTATAPTIIPITINSVITSAFATTSYASTSTTAKTTFTDTSISTSASSTNSASTAIIAASAYNSRSCLNCVM